MATQDPADCGWGIGADQIGCNIGNFVDSEAARFAEQLYEGSAQMFNSFFTSWVTDAPSPVIGGAHSDWLQFVTGPIQVFLLTMGLIVAGIRMMLYQRGEPAADAGKRLFRAVFIVVAGQVIVQILIPASNALSKWILETAQAGEAPAGILGDLAVWAGNNAMAILFGLIGAIAVGIQWIIMILRSIALTVIVPFWPVTAAAAMFEKHDKAFEKVTAWILAFLIYSPIAAALYGLAIKLRYEAESVEGVMYGMVIFALAIFALPSLVKLVEPAAAALGRASAGGVMMGATRMAITAGVAVGAAVATAGATAPAAAGAAGAGAGAGTAAPVAAEGGSAAVPAVTEAAATTAPTGAETAGESPTGAPGSGHAGADGDSASGGTGADGASQGGSDGSSGANGDSSTGAAGADGASQSGSDGTQGSSGANGDSSTGAAGADGASQGGSDGADGSSGPSGGEGASGADGAETHGANGADTAAAQPDAGQGGASTASGSGANRGISDVLRDISYALPQGSNNTVGDMIDE